jgi:hypothetical protein
MLITKELEIRIMGNVCEYYRKNNIDVEFNKVNKLPIHLINPESHLIVDAKCDVCGKEVKVQYRRYNKSVSNGGYYSCSSKCSTEKRINSFVEKYGNTIPFRTENFKEKSKQTNLKKWGSEHFRKSDKWKQEKLQTEKDLRKNTIFQNFLLENPKVVGQDDENFIIKCEIHGETKIPKGIFSNRKIAKTEYCTECNPVDKNISGKEILLFKMIRELYDGQIIQSHKVDRKEIDIFLPELKLGFEFNGVRWHSELFLKPNYHLEKTKLCQKNNIHLIHIFEDDFDFKNDIVSSIVKNAINLSDKIFARKTIIKKIKDKSVVKDFLTKNHLQGFVNTNINYGLYYNDELVSLMTFMKTRKVLNKNGDENEYELIRFCNKLNTTVIGGASKLFNKFLNEYEPSSVLSYCDLSWGTGVLYENLGFINDGDTKPNYFYVINGKKENRINYQKHKLVKQGYDPNLTESQIMNGLGYYRIYNCGNRKYLYKNEKN